MFTLKNKNIIPLLRLGAPLIINNLAIAGIQLTDALMAGRLGARELAAVAVGGSIWFLIFQTYNGLMMSISAIVSRLYGAKKVSLIGRYNRQACFMSLIIGIFVIFFFHTYIASFMNFIGIDAEFRHLVVDYLNAIIFGNFGAPALGVLGCGLASAISMWLIFIFLSSYVFFNARYKQFNIFEKYTAFRLSIMHEILKLGVPISITVTAEAGLFSAVSIMVGTLGAEITSAHQIAMNVATTTFMVPLAISAAITVKVGQSLGSNEPEQARNFGLTGIGACGLFMLFSACLLLIFRGNIISFYNVDKVVQAMAMNLLLVVALFQIVDGIQIAAAGALRGYKDTKIPMVINLFSYWILAFPLSYIVGIIYNLPPSYIWGGFVLGLSVAAFLLTFRFNRVSKGLA